MAIFLKQPLAFVTPSEQEWDTFVQTHPRGHLLQLPAWGELKSAFGWQTRRIAMLGPHGLVAGAQILLRRRYGFAAAYIPRGPLFSGHEQIDRLLFRGLRRSLRGERVVFLRVEPNAFEDEVFVANAHSELAISKWQPADTIQPRSTIQLDLTPSTESLFAQFSKGHRADIRRAERQGVQVRVGNSQADLHAFFTAMQATTARKSDYDIHSLDYYQRAWKLFSAQGRVLLLLAESEGSSVGTCMVFAGAQQGLYLYGGSNEAGLKKGANHLLQWHAIRWAKEQGCTNYDFWGIPDALGRAASSENSAAREQFEEAAKQDPLYGVYRFKKGFGGTIKRFLPAYDYVFLRPLYALWRRQTGA